MLLCNIFIHVIVERPMSHKDIFNYKYHKIWPFLKHFKAFSQSVHYNCSSNDSLERVVLPALNGLLGLNYLSS